jgi:ribonuclease P protein component
VLYARENELSYARLGLVVAKRFAARAVTRNTIKRVCREVFRKKELNAMDCIVRLTAPVMSRTESATSASLKRWLNQELEQLLTLQTKGRKSR